MHDAVHFLDGAALLEFWHADSKGEYGLKGFRYRGHVFSDRAGYFEIQTILPGLYGGRTCGFNRLAVRF